MGAAARLGNRGAGPCRGGGPFHRHGGAGRRPPALHPAGGRAVRLRRRERSRQVGHCAPADCCRSVRCARCWGRPPIAAPGRDPLRDRCAWPACRAHSNCTRARAHAASRSPAALQRLAELLASSTTNRRRRAGHRAGRAAARRRRGRDDALGGAWQHGLQWRRRRGAGPRFSCRAPRCRRRDLRARRDACSRGTAFIADARLSSLLAQRFVERFGAGSVLYVPVHGEAGVLGVLIVWWSVTGRSMSHSHDAASACCPRRPARCSNACAR